MMRRGGSLLLGAIATLGLAQAATAQRVVFDRTGYRLTSIGARVTANARVVGKNGSPVPNSRITWRVSDTSVAVVDARGVVQSKKVGRTRVWGIFGGDSASSLILVDQWASRFSFAPSVLRFAAVGERRVLDVKARDAAGNVVAGMRVAAVCRTLDPNIAAMAADGQVVARGSGSTYVRCTDRGVSDSVRVDVRQRAVRTQIADKLTMPTRFVGDSFRIRLSAFDTTNAIIQNARATWASMDARIVTIDPLSGSARAVGVGDVKIVAQVGDATDTVSVTVRPGGGLALQPVGGGVGPELAGGPDITRTASLRIDAPFPAVGDTATVGILARDATGAPVDIERDVRLRSTNTSIVAYLGRGRVVGLKQGSAYIVGTYGTLTDSALVTVRPKGTAAVASANTGSSFERPRFDTAAARLRNREQLDSARRAILRASPIRVGYNRFAAVSVYAEQASHASKVTQTVVESRNGLLFGGRAEVSPHPKLSASGDFRLGTLTPDINLGEDMKVTEVEGQLTFSPANWFALRGGYTVRAQSTPLAAQRWQFVSVSGVTRFRFVGGKLSTVTGISLLPYGSLQQSATAKLTPNATSLAGEAGLELATGPFSAGLLYHVERFTFPVQNGNERVDQFSALRLKVGVQAGR
jgi:hypothetical protein